MSNRRKTLIVNKELQRKIVLSVTLFPTLALTVSSLIVAVFCRKLLGEANRVEADLPSLVPLFVSVLGFVLASAAIVVHQAIRFSHRIAGPSYRFIKSMEQVGGGDTDFRIKLRKDDLLTEVADAFNDMLDGLDAQGPERPGEAGASPSLSAADADLPATAGDARLEGCATGGAPSAHA
ncbi:MAG: hypothetical protein AAF628_20875 [Planctomycetota bacterium]